MGGAKPYIYTTGIQATHVQRTTRNVVPTRPLRCTVLPLQQRPCFQFLLNPSLCLSLFPSPSYPQYDRARYPLPAHHRCGGVDRLRTLMVSNLAGLSWLRPYKVQLI